MTIEYINRRGKKHYLHEGQTKTGKPKYYFSQKNEGNLAEIIPDGMKFMKCLLMLRFSSEKSSAN